MGSFEVLGGQVGAGRDGFVVEEGSVVGVRHGVDCHCGLYLCRGGLYPLFVHVIKLSGDDVGDVV